jgi:predicted transcriptional regulator
MTAKLNQELTDALRSAGDALEVIDPTTQRAYVIVDRKIHERAMDALRRQEERQAIAEGLAQMEAGEGKPLDEAFASMRSRLAFPQAP